MGLVTPGAPEELIAKMIGEFPIHVFIELGTYRGDTALWASRSFHTVVTVEAAEVLHRQARDRLAANKNVELLFGDSRHVLPGICGKLQEPAVFWLDSHWSGASTAGADDECPLLDELRIILPSPQEHVLLIDDARYFLCPPSYPLTPEKWPPITEIIDVVKKFRANYDVFVINDCIVVSPPRLRSVIQSYCQRHCMIMEWRLGNYLKFLHRPSIRNLMRLCWVIGGVVLKRAGWLPELPAHVVRGAPKRFGYSDE